LRYERILFPPIWHAGRIGDGSPEKSEVSVATDVGMAVA
jgi:hypothetical protein